MYVTQLWHACNVNSATGLDRFPAYYALLPLSLLPRGLGTGNEAKFHKLVLGIVLLVASKYSPKLQHCCPFLPQVNNVQKLLHITSSQALRSTILTLLKYVAVQICHILYYYAQHSVYHADIIPHTILYLHYAGIIGQGLVHCTCTACNIGMHGSMFKWGRRGLNY